MTPEERARKIVKELDQEGWVCSNEMYDVAIPLIAKAIEDAVVEERVAWIKEALSKPIT